jgi:hypothetical protein
VWFGPRLKARPFECFFSTAAGFGTIALRDQAVHIRMLEGELRVEKLVYDDGKNKRSLDWKVTAQPGVVAHTIL